MQTSSPPAEFQRLCTEFGLELSEEEISRFGRYLALLAEANARMNLTAIRDADEAWVRHVFDSLTLLRVLAEAPAGASIADIGSGGGAPGLLLAIALPASKVTLIEATGKKAAFLEETAAALGLSNVHVVNARAEDAGQDAQFREQFDVVTARAVGPMKVVAELTIPFAKPEGMVTLIKGAKAEDELAEARQALHRLHARSAGVVETPTGRIVVLEKMRKTPAQYPRRPGEPKRDPLA
jgi:16S rRNA (guanine527-N7)-methyltransferase